jgi:hypothetical protein
MTAVLLWLGGGVAVVAVASVLALAVRSREPRRRWLRARSSLRVAPEQGSGLLLDASRLRLLPAPAQAYLRHALPAGVALARSVELVIDQRVRLNKTDAAAPFLSYRLQLALLAGRGIAGRGWSGKGKIPRSASFFYARGEAEAREALLGLLPVVLSTGANACRVLRERALIELFWLPSAYVEAGVQWQEIDGERCGVRVSLDGGDLALVLRVDPQGRLREITTERWGSVGTENRQFRTIPFGFVVDREERCDGYAIPTELRGGWWYGTERYIESIRVSVEQARFR